MRPELIAAFASHDHLLTRRQALAAGATRFEIDRWVRTGEWVNVRRGVYALRIFWDGLDEWRGKPLHVARAASAAMTRPHVMSHDSAALELGLEVLQAQHSLVHVTRKGVLGSRVEHGVKHHKAPYSAEQVQVVGGRRVLDMARTVADIARDRGLDAGLVTADSALRAGVTRAQLAAAVVPMRNWAGVTVVRDVVDLADGGAENAAESLARRLVTDLGHGRPQTQFGLTDGRRTVWCDLRVGRHVFELDGKLKYRSVEDGGLSADPARTLWEEKQRQDFISGFKLGVSRLVWADLWGEARVRAAERLEREFLETCRLYGTSIDDLAPFIVSGPRLLAS